MKRQAEIIQQMSDKDITIQLIATQIILLSIALVTSLFLFDAYWSDWMSLFPISPSMWVWYGVIPGLLILLIDFTLLYSLPKRFYDDGGINEKVFKNRTTPSVILLTLLIAISEEMLFRGVVHTQFGYVIASIVFAVIHFRYLTKPVLLISVLLVSFYIGYLFEVTESLTVTITAHFIVDAVLGLWIRYGKWGRENGESTSIKGSS
ncbi:CPBP family intramembrane metalloprotease [Halobacillus locisalis]|uniref:CPBP family intramembrane metalloprotease n=1 Tax=Halobacillus locisalis TaxID=220753 RepID=A0A838CPS9_9BACI|nr:type II CAAX endopeptidase family protein [Halobacillus locisalis]MBA2173839.1 CPBP family intramembrane metalloprotease [Halobacillus locisalis]